MGTSELGEQPARGLGTRRLPLPALVVMVFIAAVGLVVSGYLSYVSLVAGAQPVGCGPGSSCAQVLGTKWSKLLGVPVSALAMVAYLVVIATLLVVARGWLKRPRLAWSVLVTVASAMTAAAIWFTYVQLAVVKALCPYCTVAHACGLVLGSLIFWLALQQRGRVSTGASYQPDHMKPLYLAGLVALGLVGVGAMAGIQWNTPDVVFRPDLPTDRDFDLGKGTDRHIGVLNGKLQLSPHDEPITGSPDAAQIMAVMFDYACPHCRDTHKLIAQVKQQYGDGLAIMALPMPLDQKCNRHVPDGMPPRFDNSCELARLALAVWIADRSKFMQFDRWNFDWTYNARNPQDARRKAAQLVGAVALERALADPRIDRWLGRNTEASMKTGTQGLPVLITPFARPIAGRVPQADAIIRLLQEAAASRAVATGRASETGLD